MKCVYETSMPIQSKWIIHLDGYMWNSQTLNKCSSIFLFLFLALAVIFLLYQNSIACFHRKIVSINLWPIMDQVMQMMQRGPMIYSLGPQNMLFPLSIATVYRRTYHNYECTISHHCMKCTPYLTTRVKTTMNAPYLTIV